MNPKIFSKISHVLLGVLIFLTPLFMLPFTTDFFGFPKINLFLAGTLIIFLFWFLAQILAKKIVTKSNLIFYPLFLIFAANLLSFIANWNNLEKFSAIWTILPFLFFLPFSFLITVCDSETLNVQIKKLLLSAGVIISVLGIGLFLLPTNRFPLNLNILGFPLTILNSSFSLTGSNLTSLVFLACLVPYLINDFSGFFGKEKKNKFFFIKVISEAILTLIIITGAGVFLFETFSINKPIILPYQMGWAISLETLKNPLNALIGAGPGQFTSAFTRFKPINFNLSNLWAIRFPSSSNEVFQILTTLGLLGLATYLFLALKVTKNSTREPEFFAALILLATMIFLPTSFFVYFLLVVFLSLWGINRSKSEAKTYSFNKQVATVIFGAGFLVLLAGFYLLARNFSAEVNFRRSLIAASLNRGTDTYNLQIRAITQNPYRADLHQLYSQTNLALANALASNPSASSGLTDQEKQTITQLVQQGLREARNAVVLAPLDVNVWENLTSTYRQLINFAQGADQWAIASSNQTVKLDPNNPQLYLDFGGLYYSLGQYDEALSLFQTCVSLKPDFANGWYNLAAAFNQKKDYQKTFDALTQAARLVPVDSTDYQQVQKDLEEVKTKLPQPQEQKPATGESTLKLPEPIPSPKAEISPIELPTPAEVQN